MVKNIYSIEIPFAFSFGKLKNLIQVVYTVTIDNRMTPVNTSLKAFIYVFSFVCAMLEVGPQFLVPPPGMEPALPALGVQSHNEKQRAKRDLKD